MQKLLIKTKDAYTQKIFFLQDLINTFTKKLKIDNRLFYYKINNSLKYSGILSSVVYNGNGLLFFENTLKDYSMLKKSVKVVHQIAPYLSSLSRVLAFIYREASRIVGEEQAKKILKKSFDSVKKNYTEVPDLQGYVPQVVLGRVAKAKAKAYPIILMDQMINYLVNDVIKKDKKIERIIAVRETKGSA